MHELVEGFLLSCRAVVVKNMQLPEKISTVLEESRLMERNVLFPGIDERIRSLNEVHKIILIGTMESIII